MSHGGDLASVHSNGEREFIYNIVSSVWENNVSGMNFNLIKQIGEILGFNEWYDSHILNYKVQCKPLTKIYHEAKLMFPLYN